MRLAIYAFALVVIYLFWGAVLVLANHDRERTIADVMTSNANLARAFEEHTVRTLNAVDQLSLLIKKQYEKQGRSFDLAQFFEDAGVSSELLVNSVISDETGYTVAGSARSFKPADLSDREHVKVHVEGDSGKMFISKPVLARVSGRASIIMTRRINKPDGSYGGVIGIAIDPYYFTNLYKQVNLGTRSVVALIGTDGIVRARLSDTGSQIGQDISKSEFHRRAGQVAADSYLGEATTDGVRRIFSYRTLQSYPLVVSIGVAEDVALSEDARRKRYYIGAALAMTLVVLLGAWALLGLLRKAEHSARLLREMNETLTKRTSELSAINGELQTFSYSISHDLKAPLRGIDGYSSLLLEEFGDKVGDDGRRYLTNLRQGAQQMNLLITDLLAYTRVERAAPEAESVELQSLVSGLIADRADDIAAAKATVVNAVPPLTLVTDRRGLAMALRNFLDNALKFTKGAALPMIEVGAHDEGAAIRIWVKDNGPGFDMAFHDKIFEMFQRLNRVEEYSGTGIGLAMVRKAAERMHGRAWAESKPGEGATFYLRIGK